MTNREENRINQFLSDTDFNSDSSFFTDDTDNDPTFVPGGHRNTNSPSSSSDNLSTPGPSTGTLQNQIDYSNEENSFDNTSSDDSDYNNSNSNSTDTLWKDDYISIPDFNFDTTTSGIKLNIEDTARHSPSEIFNQIWTKEIIDIIVKSTNAYGLNQKNKSRPHGKYSRKSKFTETNPEEIKKFLGMCMLMGSLKFPSLRDIFSNNPLYYHPIIKYTMSGRCFEQLLSYFSVEYSGLSTDTGPMSKLNPLFKILIANFQKAFYPGEDLSLDESLLLHRGRLSFRQYIKGKKAKYGIKFFELCDPNGYVLNIEVYKGKNNYLLPSTNSKTDSLVLRLMDPYLCKGHSLFMDNYYNSTTLSELLLKKKTHTTGTLRINRKGNPEEVTKKKLKKGDHVWRRKNEIYISKWKDKRDVTIITTKYHPQIVTSTNKYGQQKLKPIEIVNYNEKMSGVDRCDQMNY
ncbi:piggyBac transposable element-derived protein 4-like [Aphis gossypii]|uniref:piggyBac transposable element-derived protein 4-like n=1 Tax=Aphis gossypii TaxID=80765 RepID=UPI0021599F8A|nr:piggyBac transposable element-derived protein 4-like [Aphis gossypii]